MSQLSEVQLINSDVWWCLSFVNCLFKDLQLIEGRLFLNKPGLWEGIKAGGGSEAFVIIISFVSWVPALFLGFVSYHFNAALC